MSVQIDKFLHDLRIRLRLLALRRPTISSTKTAVGVQVVDRSGRSLAIAT